MVRATRGGDVELAEKGWVPSNLGCFLQTAAGLRKRASMQDGEAGSWTSFEGQLYDPAIPAGEGRLKAGYLKTM